MQGLTASTRRYNPLRRGSAPLQPDDEDTWAEYRHAHLNYDVFCLGGGLHPVTAHEPSSISLEEVHDLSWMHDDEEEPPASASTELSTNDRIVLFPSDPSGSRVIETEISSPHVVEHDCPTADPLDTKHLSHNSTGKLSHTMGITRSPWETGVQTQEDDVDLGRFLFTVSPIKSDCQDDDEDGNESYPEYQSDEDSTTSTKSSTSLPFDDTSSLDDSFSDNSITDDDDDDAHRLPHDSSFEDVDENQAPWSNPDETDAWVPLDEKLVVLQEYENLLRQSTETNSPSAVRVVCNIDTPLGSPFGSSLEPILECEEEEDDDEDDAEDVKCNSGIYVDGERYQSPPRQSHKSRSFTEFTKTSSPYRRLSPMSSPPSTRCKTTFPDTTQELDLTPRSKAAYDCLNLLAFQSS